VHCCRALPAPPTHQCRECIDGPYDMFYPNVIANPLGNRVLLVTKLLEFYVKTTSYLVFLKETTYSAVMSQIHDDVELTVSPVTPNLTPYIGTAVFAMSIQAEFEGKDEYPLNAPLANTAGVKLGTRSMTQSSCPVKVATVSYCIRSVTAVGAVLSSRSMTMNTLGTAALGDAVLNTDAAFVLARMYSLTFSNRYWSKREANVIELARSDNWKAMAPKTPVAPP